jgi:integrase
MATKTGAKSKKAANGAGSIREIKQDGKGTGRWWARMVLDNGKRKAFYGPSEKAVRDQLVAAMADQQKGHTISTNASSVAAYLAAWLESMRGTVRDSTHKRYRELLAHATPTLGRTRLAKLTPGQVKALYADLRAQGLSSSTVHRVHSVLHLALKHAVADEIIGRNVVALVKAPAENERDHTALDAAQIVQFRAAAAEDVQWGALWEVLITCGLRIGEALALTWAETTLGGAHPSLRVVASMKRNAASQWEPMTPKTKTSRRTVLLRPEVVAALQRHRIRQKAMRMAAGAAWDEHDLVFPNRLGGPMDATHLLRRAFYPFLKRAGLPRMRLHDLRHTCATWLIHQREPATDVAKFLGHADGEVTMRIYAHALPSGQGRLLAAWDDVTVVR